MQHFRSNPPSRQVPPRPVLVPSVRHAHLVAEGTPHALIERYLDKTGMAPSALGRLIANDSRLVIDMRKGREPGEEMQTRIAAFFDRLRRHGEVIHA